MSDAAFKTAKYPAYTTKELRQWVAEHDRSTRKFAASQYIAIVNEISRREKRDAGDWSVMTDGERLRHAQSTGRTMAGNNISGI
jgi:hypothetical protein